jgi:3-mercaptopyruvate sulfurtransferase SseA
MAEPNPRSKLVPVLMVIAGLALILGSLAWIAFTSRQTAARVEQLPAPVTSPRIPYPDIKRATLEEARTAFDAGSVVFVDVRGEPYYSQGHIPGAISISLEELPNRLGELDKTARIITYCT